jgi:hypothetical protein
MNGRRRVAEQKRSSRAIDRSIDGAALRKRIVITMKFGKAGSAFTSVAAAISVIVLGANTPIPLFTAYQLISTHSGMHHPLDQVRSLVRLPAPCF